MKLKLFDFVDDTLLLLNERVPELEKSAATLETFFKNIFSDEEGFLNITSRIKKEGSLKEKILRHNFYHRYHSPEAVLDDLSDLIGLRMECRFNKDEQGLYRFLLKTFSKEVNREEFSTPDEPDILLSLRERQPQYQKNGFEIYKIDGRYLGGERPVHFELQIKSMVNVFWGEIDHRILYKNYNYMLTESFFRDIMVSMKENLAMIDRQLMVLYDHVNGLDDSLEEGNRRQVKALLSKIIHDIYVNKVREDLGFLIDFKKTTDFIVDYLYSKSDRDGITDYGKNFLFVLDRLNHIGEKELDFTQCIVFDREIRFEDEFSQIMGNVLSEAINRDFGWNLFFKIIFQMEEGNPADLFCSFIRFLRKKLVERFSRSMAHLSLTEEQRLEMEDYLLSLIALDFRVNNELDYILEKSFNHYAIKINAVLLGIESFDEFKENKDRLRYGLLGRE